MFQSFFRFLYKKARHLGKKYFLMFKYKTSLFIIIFFFLDLVESEVAVLDEKLQFAKLCSDLAKDFPLQKFQQLRSILSG